jgi:adenylate cyclase class 2
MNFQETEIKFYVQDISRLAERLRLCGAELTQQRVLERNLRLDTPDSALQREGRLLRLREDNQVTVTYKEKARLDDGVVTRTEIEFTADQLLTVQKLFESLGYQVVVCYEKFRRIYQIGDVKVMLDELPFGDFIEIEAPNATLIEGVSQMLGLNWSCAVQTNYLGLWAIARQNAGLTFRDLTFENFNQIKLTHTNLGVVPADG